MISVIDTSAAVEIALNKEKAETFKTVIAESEVVLAPDLYVSEVTNVFWKYRRLTEITDAQCREAIHICLEMVDDFVSTKNLWREVFTQSVASGHSAYDIFYLVTARRNGAQLLTCDKKLITLADQLQIPTIK